MPYKGVGFLSDLVGGSIDLAFVTLIDGHPLIESGRIKALGVGAAERSPLLSDVPTLAETIPGFLSSAWFAMAAPPKTPPAIAQKLSFAIAGALREPDSIARLQSLKATLILNSPAEAAAFIAEDRERWRKVIVAAAVTQE